MPIGAALAWDDDRCQADNHLSGEGTYLGMRVDLAGLRGDRVGAGSPLAAVTALARMSLARSTASTPPATALPIDDPSCREVSAGRPGHR